MTEHTRPLALIADIVARHAGIAMTPTHLASIIRDTGQFLAPTPAGGGATATEPPHRRRRGRPPSAGSAPEITADPQVAMPPAVHLPQTPATEVRDRPPAELPSLPTRRRLTVADLGGGLAQSRPPQRTVEPAPVPIGPADPPATPPQTTADVDAPAWAATIKSDGLTKSEARAQAERLFIRRG